MTYKLIYVCANNKGRSVALAAYTEHFLKLNGIEEVEIYSGGIEHEMIESLKKREMYLASHNVRKVLKDEGIDVENHRIRHVEDIINDSNLILVSDELSLIKTRFRFPEYKRKSFLAKKYAGYKNNLEIFGPYAESRTKRIGKDWTERDLYRDMLKETKVVAKRVVEELVK